MHSLRALPPHLRPPPAPAPETAGQRRDRQLALTRELAELNMIAARDAGHRIATRDAQADPPACPAGADPTLALARATRAVTALIAIENRIVAGETARPPAADDPRAPALRELLHPLVARERDPARRRALRLRIEDRIEDALGADLDDDLPLAHVAFVIARENGLELDLAKIPDRFLDPPGTIPIRPEARNRDLR